MTRAGTTYRLYVDGRQHATAEAPAITYVQFVLGGGVPGRSQWDDVRLYRRALSAEEVQTLARMQGAAGQATCVATEDAREVGGAVTLDAADLALGEDGAVALRFADVPIPKGARIITATVEFQAGGETGGTAPDLTGGLLDYGTGARDGTAAVGADGRTITLTGPARKALPFARAIRPETVLAFDFHGMGPCEAQGIGLDSSVTRPNLGRIVQLAGTGSLGLRQYKAAVAERRSYRIPIGTHYTGAMTHLVLINDAAADSQAAFRNIRLYEPGPAQAEACALVIRGEVADQSATLTADARSLTARPHTRLAVPWTPEPWTTGSVSLTPDVGGLVQEITARDGWAPGHALTLTITGTGRRLADALDKPWGGPARLRLVWQMPAE